MGIGTGMVMLCGSPGWIVFFLGVAFLLIWMLTRGERGNKKNNDKTPKKSVSYTDTYLFVRFLFHEDNNVLGDLVGRHKSPLRAFLTRMTRGDSHLADDLALETFFESVAKALHLSRQRKIFNLAIRNRLQ